MDASDAACLPDCCGRGAASPAGASAFGVASASASGRIKSMMPPKMISVFCQPVESIRKRASGENRNWPNDPAAVPAPNANERHSGGTILPSAPITRLNEQLDSAKPISTPAVRLSRMGESEEAIRASPAAQAIAPVHSTRTAPYRSATPPANGWNAPHNRFWIARAQPNTSRPQWYSSDIGLRNWPTAERGPKLSIAMAQPQAMTKTGVRQELI